MGGHVKTFTVRWGDDDRVWNHTMTVGELREVLAGYPADMAVVATWEGIHVPLAPKDFATGVPQGGVIPKESWLVIDANKSYNK
jgi:hypothetical protein